MPPREEGQDDGGIAIRSKRRCAKRALEQVVASAQAMTGSVQLGQANESKKKTARTFTVGGGFQGGFGHFQRVAQSFVKRHGVFCARACSPPGLSLLSPTATVGLCLGAFGHFWGTLGHF